MAWIKRYAGIPMAASQLRSSFIWSFFGLVLAALVGYFFDATLAGAAKAFFICFLLSLLEVSISFDNAVVNATVLERMTPVWRHRFLTWGILIAVFGMRLVFPLAIVGIATGLNPFAALMLAAREPAEYQRIMLSVHHQLAAFGGSFLFLVAFSYFFDEEKQVHWIKSIERPFAVLSRISAIEIGAVLFITLVFAQFLPGELRLEFVEAAIYGILCHLMVDGLSEFLKAPTGRGLDAGRLSLGLFLYLEVLDASFSFDGVIGAFALTTNIFLIAIGLGIGAFFVRSLTILLVEKKTLAQYKYLEHGAFYAVGALALMMYLGTVVHVPEVVTGALGAAFIGSAVFSSALEARRG